MSDLERREQVESGADAGHLLPPGERDDVMVVLAEFEQGLKGLKQLYAERQALQTALQKREVDLLLRETEVGERAKQSETVRDELERTRRELEAQREEISKGRAEIEDAQRRVAAAREEVSKRELEAQQAAATEAEKLAQQRAEGEAIKGKLLAARKEIEQAARATAEVERKRAEIAGESERLAVRLAEIEALQVRATESREQVEQAERALAELERRRSEFESAHAQAQQSTEALDAERARLTELSADIERREADLAESYELIESLRERSAALLGVVEEYEQVRTLEHEGTGAVAEQLEASRGEVQELENVVEQLRERLKQEVVRRRELEEQGADAAMSEELESLRAENEQLRARPMQAAPMTDERVAHKTQRLKAYRTAIKSRSEILRRGQEALKKRYEQAEKVLAQRADVARAHAQLTALGRKLEKRKATRGTGIAVLCVTLAMGVLAALSWAMSKQMVMGEYAAKCVIRADGRGRELTNEELTEWTKFHEELAADPRFADAVSKRMGRKGMAELGSPGAVAEVVRDRLTVTAPVPGELWLELRGKGESRVKRELDTISATLASEANMARTGQSFAAATGAPTPADTGGAPIDQSQLITAGVMMAAGTLFTLVVGYFVWKRLSQAKTKFEHDANMAAILDETNWGEAAAKLAA